mmetsp:Transcript_103237/g.301122  ORF Transcript_103237/g.301122 Transcript_103237/m.301122 type:complete len:217 (+) Transcript_103237:312-962(+)
MLRTNGGMRRSRIVVPWEDHCLPRQLRQPVERGEHGPQVALGQVVAPAGANEERVAGEENASGLRAGVQPQADAAGGVARRAEHGEPGAAFPAHVQSLALGQRADGRRLHAALPGHGLHIIPANSNGDTLLQEAVQSRNADLPTASHGAWQLAAGMVEVPMGVQGRIDLLNTEVLLALAQQPLHVPAGIYDHSGTVALVPRIHHDIHVVCHLCSHL